MNVHKPCNGWAIVHVWLLRAGKTLRRKKIRLGKRAGVRLSVLISLPAGYAVICGGYLIRWLFGYSLCGFHSSTILMHKDATRGVTGTGRRSYRRYRGGSYPLRIPSCVLRTRSQIGLILLIVAAREGPGLGFVRWVGDSEACAPSFSLLGTAWAVCAGARAAWRGWRVIAANSLRLLRYCGVVSSCGAEGWRVPIL